MLLQGILGIIAPFFAIYLPKLIVDLLTDQLNPPLFFSQLNDYIYIIFFILCMILVKWLYGLSSSAQNSGHMLYRFYKQSELFLKSISCDYDKSENADERAKYYQAIVFGMRFNGGFAAITSSLSNMIVGTLGFLLYSSVLSRLNIYLVVLLIGTSLISFFSQEYARKYELKRQNDAAINTQKYRRILSWISNLSYGKEIRLYNMNDLLIEERNRYAENCINVRKSICIRELIPAVSNVLLSMLRDGVAYIYLIYIVIGGNINPGDFILYLGAISGFSDWVTMIMTNIVKISSGHSDINLIRSYIEMTDRPDPKPAAKILPANEPIDIEFKNVSFSYGNDNNYVVDNVNIKVKKGEKIALVGANGTGKTTLVKLLCGFYIPQKGQILYNGINIHNFIKEERFSIISSVFQDLFVLPGTIAENVAATTTENIDSQKVKECLSKAGLYDYVSKLQKGIDSQLLKIKDRDGIILSGGQYQKLLMARALYKNSALLILDEPTAALDPIAESEVYERYLKLFNDRTTLFISHRLASTKFCDRIIFFDKGRIVEEGSHEELLKLNGQYAKMFEIQSYYYKYAANEVASF